MCCSLWTLEASWPPSRAGWRRLTSIAMCVAFASTFMKPHCTSTTSKCAGCFGATFQHSPAPACPAHKHRQFDITSGYLPSTSMLRRKLRLQPRRRFASAAC